MDAKTLCDSVDGPDTLAGRVLSMFAHDLGTTLAQVSIPATTTEVGMLPDLLSDLVLESTIIMGEAH